MKRLELLITIWFVQLLNISFGQNDALSNK